MFDIRIWCVTKSPRHAHATGHKGRPSRGGCDDDIALMEAFKVAQRHGTNAQLRECLLVLLTAKLCCRFAQAGWCRLLKPRRAFAFWISTTIPLYSETWCKRRVEGHWMPVIAQDGCHPPLASIRMVRLPCWPWHPSSCCTRRAWRPQRLQR